MPYGRDRREHRRMNFAKLARGAAVTSAHIRPDRERQKPHEVDRDQEGRALCLPALRFGPDDQRPECPIHLNIAFGDEAAAEKSAERAGERVGLRPNYFPTCKWWHVKPVREGRRHKWD